MGLQGDSYKPRKVTGDKPVTFKKISKMRLKMNYSLGFTIEAIYEEIFKKLGFKDCKSTRKDAKLLDSCKVDLENLPVLIQIKAGIQETLNEAEVLRSMEQSLKKNFHGTDNIHKMPKVLIHHRPKAGTAKRRSKYDSIITMTFHDLLPLLLAYQKQLNNEIHNK